MVDVSSGNYSRGRGGGIPQGRGGPGGGSRGRGGTGPRGNGQAWRGGNDFRGTARGGRGDGDFRGAARGGRGDGHFRGFARGGCGDGDFGGPGLGGRGFQGRGGYGDESSRGGRGRGFRGRPAIYAPGTATTIDRRLQDGSQEKLLDSLKSWSVEEKELQKAGTLLPLRPDFGTDGREIKLRSNYFPVVVPDAPIFEYSVLISPAKPKKIATRVKRRVFQLAEQSPQWVQCGLKGRVAHDHIARVLSAKELLDPTTIEVDYYEEDEEGPSANAEKYTVTLTKSRNLHLQDLVNFTAGERQYKDFDIAPLLSALNIILASHATRTGGEGIMVGRNKFFFPNTSMVWELGGGLQAFRGFYSSVRPTHYQLMVNVNVCATAFYKPGNLASAMIEFMKASFDANPKDFVKRGLKVSVTHLQGRYKTINTLSNRNAAQYTFETPEYPNTISVEAYFKKKYGITLKHPDLPLVDVSGSRKMKVLLPAEVCIILPNQAFLGKFTRDHTKMMVECAAQPPNVNATTIVDEGLKLLGFTSSSSPRDSFGVAIDPKMVVVPGRILRPPKVEYGKSTPDIDDKKASWNLRGVKFLQAGRKLENWVVLSIHDDKQAPPPLAPAQQLVTEFIKVCQNSGTQAITQPKYYQISLPPFNRDDPLRENAINAIEQRMKQIKPNPNLALILLSNKDKNIYSGIKRVFDTVLDIASVCSVYSTFAQGQVQNFANIALKINAKLGGVNHKLDKTRMTWLQQVPTMVVGIDVTHANGKVPVRGTPSIAAVVASCDANFAQYPASMEMQEYKKEMVQALDKMMVARLKLFQQRTAKLPERILIYRDGVSEGQYWLVMKEEFPKLQAAFQTFDKPQKRYEPKLTIVICGKRHHTRFYPTAEADADPSKKNPLPGTVVDRGVTSVYHFDFFLQAHAGLQGSTKPTHYFVVHDTIGFNANRLQQLTNDICYMFARATKAVSLASPAYYADLACERGRCYLHGLLQGYSCTGRTSSSDNYEEVEKEAAKLWNKGVNGQRLKDTMYYL